MMSEIQGIVEIGDYQTSSPVTSVRIHQSNATARRDHRYATIMPPRQLSDYDFDYMFVSWPK